MQTNSGEVNWPKNLTRIEGCSRLVAMTKPTVIDCPNASCSAQVHYTFRPGMREAECTTCKAVSPLPACSSTECHSVLSAADPGRAEDARFEFGHLGPSFSCGTCSLPMHDLCSKQGKCICSTRAPAPAPGAEDQEEEDRTHLGDGSGGSGSGGGSGGADGPRKRRAFTEQSEQDRKMDDDSRDSKQQDGNDGGGSGGRSGGGGRSGSGSGNDGGGFGGVGNDGGGANGAAPQSTTKPQTKRDLLLFVDLDKRKKLQPPATIKDAVSSSEASAHPAHPAHPSHPVSIPCVHPLRPPPASTHCVQPLRPPPAQTLELTRLGNSRTTFAYGHSVVDMGPGQGAWAAVTRAQWPCSLQFGDRLIHKASAKGKRLGGEVWMASGMSTLIAIYKAGKAGDSAMACVHATLSHCLGHTACTALYAAHTHAIHTPRHTTPRTRTLTRRTRTRTRTRVLVAKHPIHVHPHCLHYSFLSGMPTEISSRKSTRQKSALLLTRQARTTKMISVGWSSFHARQTVRS